MRRGWTLWHVGGVIVLFVALMSMCGGHQNAPTSPSHVTPAVEHKP